MIFTWNKFNVFLIINYLFLINRLKVNCLIWILIFSINDLFLVLNWLGYIRQIFNSIIFPQYSYSFFNCFNTGLSNSFFDNSVTRTGYGNLSHNSFIVNFSVSGDLLSVNRSFCLTLFDNWCLNDSLSDNWLRNYFSGDYWLSDYFLLDQRLVDYFLCLGDKWSGIVDLVAISNLGLSFLYFNDFCCLLSGLVDLSSSLRLDDFDLSSFNHFF